MFSNNSSFLDDARDANCTLPRIHWNAHKESLMDFAATISDLYAKLKDTEYENIITPIELCQIWIMALSLPNYCAICNKITTNNQLSTNWSQGTTISSLIAATCEEIASQKAHIQLCSQHADERYPSTSIIVFINNSISTRLHLGSTNIITLFHVLALVSRPALASGKPVL
jgi:hypothetical protein